MSIDPVDQLFKRAEAHSVAMAAICERAKVAQSTPSRWRTDRNGATYATIKKLNRALDELIGEKGGVPHLAAPTAEMRDSSARKSPALTPPGMLL